MTDPSRSDRSFQTDLQIAAPRDAVWRALTEAREIERWFAPRAEVTPGAGGTMRWQWGDAHVWRQTIEVFEPGRHLRTRYDSPVDDGAGGRRPLFVDFHLEGDGGTTTLRLVHSGFGPEVDFDQEYDGISKGWPTELRSLRLYLERHRGRDRHLAWAQRSTPEDAETVWRRLIGEHGLRAPRLPQTPRGGRFAVHCDPAGVIEGTMLHVPSAHEFTGVADTLGEGWFRVHCEHWGGATQVWLWLALYGDHGRRAPAFAAAFERILDRCVTAGTDSQPAAEQRA